MAAESIERPCIKVEPNRFRPYPLQENTLIRDYSPEKPIYDLIFWSRGGLSIERCEKSGRSARCKFGPYTAYWSDLKLASERQEPLVVGEFRIEPEQAARLGRLKDCIGIPVKRALEELLR